VTLKFKTVKEDKKKCPLITSYSDS